MNFNGTLGAILAVLLVIIALYVVVQIFSGNGIGL